MNHKQEEGAGAFCLVFAILLHLALEWVVVVVNFMPTDSACLGVSLCQPTLLNGVVGNENTGEGALAWRTEKIQRIFRDALHWMK